PGCRVSGASMMRVLLAAAVSLAITAGAAEARPIPKDGLAIEDVIAFLKAEGFEPKVERGDDGTRYVQAELPNGVKFEVDLYDCADNKCRALQFLSSFDLKEPLGAEKANAWNQSKRYVRVYLDESGDPIFAYDANVAPGGTFEALQDDLDVFLQFLPEILQHIGW
ncbi:MAG: YbjN domain-containing protein, partial [Phenylobacterium sp.]|nr:YbjN domain-containing protein [Phenylobacterium sp.]